MVNKGWTKHFLDGEKELGTDKLITEGLASWRNGRLEDICAVDIQENNLVYTLKNPLAKEWWQGDRCKARYAGPNSVEGELVYRFVQFKIEKEHLGRYIVANIALNKTEIALTDSPKVESVLMPIDAAALNKWLTLIVIPGESRPKITLRNKKG